MLRRCVKWIPQPDSFAFHHRPVNAPGTFAVTLVAAAGGTHTSFAGTVATQRWFAGSTDCVPLVPVPTQKVAPATWELVTLCSTLTDCSCADCTVPMAERLAADTSWRPELVNCASTQLASSFASRRRTRAAGA